MRYCIDFAPQGPPPPVYVRNEDDNWVWPGVQVGHRQKVSLPVSEFYDMDAPPGGFSEDLPEAHWSPPPEMSEVGYAGAIDSSGFVELASRLDSFAVHVLLPVLHHSVLHSTVCCVAGGHREST